MLVRYVHYFTYIDDDSCEIGAGFILNSWIKSIVVFTVFFSLVLFLLPDEKYRKYIRTAIGFIMVIVVINPILSLGDLNDYLSFDYYYEAAGSQVSMSNTGYYRDLMENVIEEYLLSSYRLKTDADILFDDSYTISSLHLFIDASSLEDVENIDISEIKSDIASMYGIPEENIDIRVS